MRVAIALLALVGCRQVFGLDDPQTRVGDAGPRDGNGGPPSDVLTDAPPPFCAQADNTLRACFDFENTLMSGAAPMLALTTQNVTYTAGQQGGFAANFGSASFFTIAENPALDVSGATIEAWIQPASFPPSGGRSGVWDTDNQYGLFITNNSILCTFSDVVLSAPFAFPSDNWTHVACTGDAVAFKTYVNGEEVLSGTGASLNTTTNVGSALGGNAPTGDRFDGAIDRLRIFSVARSPAQICAAANKTGC